jgi:hypothetical protein
MLAYLDTLIGFAVVMLGASLLVTILTQMISALLSHRGANLRWGLENLFKHIPNSPLMNDAATAKKLANDVLTHPLISDSIFSLKPQWLADRIRLATAIRPDELVAILRDLATKAPYNANPGLPAEIDALIGAANLAASRRINLLTVISSLPEANAVPLLQNTLNSVKDEAGRLEAWFNASMVRVSQRFTTYIRLWTIGFASALALFTGLNSVTLLNTIYTNGDFRQQLVGAAPQMLDLSGRVLPNGPADAQTKMFTDLVNQALQTSKVATDGTKPAGIASQADAEAWIKAHVPKPEDQTAAINALGSAFLDQRTRDAAAVRTILTKASFDLNDFGWKRDQPYGPQLPGVFVTAAFLSLGAPFWFNMLKQLSNLRPILANKQDEGK